MLTTIDLTTLNILLSTVWLLSILIIMLKYLRPGYIFEYLMFLRYPILCALSLMLLPLIATTLLPKFIANLFVIDDWIGLLLITALAVLCSWIILFSGGLIMTGGDQRYRLQAEKKDPQPEATWLIRNGQRLWEEPIVKGPRPALNFTKIHQLWWYDFRKNFNYWAIFFPIILTSSLLGSLYGEATYSTWWLAVAVIAGIGVAILVSAIALGLIVVGQVLGYWLYSQLKDTAIWLRLQQRATATLAFLKEIKIPVVSRIIKAICNACEHLDDTPFTHRRAIYLFLVVGLMYGLGYRLFNPAQPNVITYHTPPLIYFILLIMLATLILSSLSYFFDRHRIPIMPLIVAIYIISYYLPGADHYYEFAAAPTLAADATPAIKTPEDVVTKWDDYYQAQDHPTMVVVAASGGGIKAAAWTAYVLGALRNDPQLGLPFAESITLVSTVSGGSVGGMYALDQYQQPNLPLADAFDQANASSLNAIAWGVAYPDLLRTIIPFVDETNDRGIATERAWRAQLNREPTTLLSWPQTVEKQWQPLQVFNTTIAETGQRLLLSPIEIRNPYPVTRYARARNFVTLYPGCDLSMVTAARLSATFPYVTPIARPLATDACAKDETAHYHVADGGYYDNFGVMTVLEFLSELTPENYKAKFHRDKILLVQIRASALEDVDARAASSDGFMYASLGPGLTALQVQTATQIERNDFELGLLKEQWAREGVTVESVVFELRKEVTLSWHLSPQEKRDIINEFTEKHNKINLEKLKAMWGMPDLTEAIP